MLVWGPWQLSMVSLHPPREQCCASRIQLYSGSCQSSSLSFASGVASGPWWAEPTIFDSAAMSKRRSPRNNWDSGSSHSYFWELLCLVIWGAPLPQYAGLLRLPLRSLPPLGSSDPPSTGWTEWSDKKTKQKLKRETHMAIHLQLYFCPRTSSQPLSGLCTLPFTHFFNFRGSQ